MKYLISKSRIPHEYFFTSGKGQSSYGGKGDPFEAGSYDAALNMAKIENSNIIKYTSVVPPKAKMISREKGLKYLEWGDVLETIMAQMNGVKGQTITASVLKTCVYNKQGKYLGSFACEYAGYSSREHAMEVLLHDISEMLERRGYGTTKASDLKFRNKIKTSKGFYYKPEHFISETLEVKQKFGTVLAAICFVNHKYPIQEIIDE
jgi:arginine decarboxylase